MVPVLHLVEVAFRNAIDDTGVQTTAIGRAFAELRDFRNLVAHHQPIWDRKPVDWHRRAVELLDWMNPSVAAVAQASSRLDLVYNAGPEAFRAVATAAVTF